MRVLLVYPNLHGMNMLPPSMGIFTGLLRSQGHEVDLFDTTNWVIPGEEDFDSDKVKEKNLNARPYDDSILRSEIRTSDVFEDFRNKVTSFKPQLLAVSSTEDMFPLAIRLLKSVKELNIPVIMGGVFPTFAPEICISYDEIDMVCIGEGEVALSELAMRMEQRQSYDDVENLWVKKPNGKITKNPIGRPTDVNSNELIDFSLFDESRLYRPMQGRTWRMLPVETHRGCPYSCTYCNSPSQRQLYRENGCHFFRKKSFDKIREELLYYKNGLKAEALYFWADMFMAYNERELDEFLDMYSDIDLPFWCQVRPETIREERIKRLQKAGLFRLGIGVEHGNDEFRRNMLKRRVTNKTMIENFRILNKLELPFSVNNIVGFPTETRELAMDTVEVNRQIDADSYNIYSYTPFTGTPLRKICEEEGYIEPGTIVESALKPTLLKMPQFPAHEIEGIRRTFVLYVKMPRDRWADIRKAEAQTPEADALLEQLRVECRDKYLWSS
ncbi:MAG: B12-binding domain-containing radical SAM protein [Acidobacteriota bacterium]